MLFVFFILIIAFLIPQRTYQHTDCRDYRSCYNHSKVWGIQFVKRNVVCHFKCTIFSKHIHCAKENCKCPFSFSPKVVFTNNNGHNKCCYRKNKPKEHQTVKAMLAGTATFHSPAGNPGQAKKELIARPGHGNSVLPGTPRL